MYEYHLYGSHTQPEMKRRGVIECVGGGGGAKGRAGAKNGEGVLSEGYRDDFRSACVYSFVLSNCPYAEIG